MPEGSIPKRVEELVKEIARKNPRYKESQRWATAWSIYCRYIEPGSKHCHKSVDEYLDGRRRDPKQKRKPKQRQNKGPKPTSTVSQGLTLMSDGSWRRIR